MRFSSRINHVGPKSNSKCPSRKSVDAGEADEREDMHTHTGEGDVKQRQKWSDVATSQRSRQRPATKSQGMDSSLKCL